MVMSGQEVVIFAYQTALGTARAPSSAQDGVLVPVIPGTFRASENFEQILDTGRRGIDSMDFRAIHGVGWSEITWDGYVQLGRSGGATDNPKTGIGYLIANLLGSDGTVAEIASTDSFDHRLILGTTKEYITIQHDSGGITGANDRQFTDCRVTELTIRWNAGEGALTYTVTLVGQTPTSVTAETPTDYNGDPWRGWQGKVTFDGNASFGRLISGEWTMRRAAERYYSTQEQQKYADVYLGPLEVLCSMVLDFNVITDLTAFRANNQAELSTRFRVGTLDSAAERTFGIGGILMDLGDGPAELDNSGTAVRLGLTARGLYSTANGPFVSNTNAATAQNGPVQIQIVQRQSTIYDLDLSTT
jgi:hypothetical protein